MTNTTLTAEWLETFEDLGFNPGETEKLTALVAMAEDYGIDAYQFCEFYQGETTGYTEEEAGEFYAQQLADDCGYDIATTWPHNCIDWAMAWRELRLGDGYAVHPVPGECGIWWVTRNV